MRREGGRGEKLKKEEGTGKGGEEDETREERGRKHEGR